MQKLQSESCQATEHVLHIWFDLLPLQAGHEANQTEVRFELWRRVKEQVFERWEEHTCSLNPAKPAEPVSIEAEGGAGVQGLRHRLQVHITVAQHAIMIVHGHTCLQL